MSCVENCEGGYAWDVIKKLLTKINIETGHIRNEQKNQILINIQNAEIEMKILSNKLVKLRLQAKDIHIGIDDKKSLIID